ncbi:hypothetical protein ALC53_03730 [Atta colombica]|uniref:Uncharacterized protein n=1 Tax=Atta colombica TaxID=520822 RepID=A0A195BMJ7_9HYME|nr:hypothetical protein ALC53_03730 [Atta colombica]
MVSPLWYIYTDAMVHIVTIACNVVLMLKQQVVFLILSTNFTWLFDHAPRHAHSWGLSLTIARAKRRIPFSFVVSGSRAVCSLSHEKQSVKRDDSRMQKLVKRTLEKVCETYFALYYNFTVINRGSVVTNVNDDLLLDSNKLLYHEILARPNDNGQPYNNTIIIEPKLTHDVVIAHYNRRCVMQASHVCRTLQL